MKFEGALLVVVTVRGWIALVGDGPRLLRAWRAWRRWRTLA